MALPRKHLLLLVVSYYVASTLTSCLTKQVLTAFPRPLTVSLLQQLVTAAGGVARVTDVRRALLDEWRAVLPVAVTLCASVVLYRVSLVHSTLSFAQAVKTLQPLFATLLSSVVLRERSSARRVLALAMLVAGVSIATTTELDFSLVGFACTLASTFAQALETVLSKACLVRHRIDAADLFAAAAVYTALLMLPFWLVLEARSLLSGEPPQLVGSGAVPMLSLNAACNFATQTLSFAVLVSVSSPVTAAVVSAFKRIAVIVAAVLWFGTRVTLAHASGVALAVSAVALFQSAGTPKLREGSDALLLPLSLAQTPRRPRSGGGSARASL